MGIFYDEAEYDEEESDAEYEAWFKRTIKNIDGFEKSSRKVSLQIGGAINGNPKESGDHK